MNGDRAEQVLQCRGKDTCPFCQSKDLKLQQTDVTDAGLSALKPLSKLRQLNLAVTFVTDQGVEPLQRALAECEIQR